MAKTSARKTDGDIRRYSIAQIQRMKGKTDWERVRAMTDEEIEASIADDPDWAEFKDIDWSKAEVVRRVNKVPVSIRLDPDIFEFFKAGGAGYQRRINRVLRAYMEQRRGKD